jgi:hypothetical protein
MEWWQLQQGSWGLLRLCIEVRQEQPLVWVTTYTLGISTLGAERFASRWSANLPDQF